MNRRISLRNKPAILKRNMQGQFIYQCGSTVHTCSNADRFIKLIDLVSRKRISAANYRKVLSSGIISADSKHICKDCLDIGLSQSNKIKNEDYKEAEDATNQSTSTDTNNLDDEFVEFGRKLREIILPDVTNLFKTGLQCDRMVVTKTT